MSRPFALVSNDDGISSFYLRALIDELKAHFDIVVAAPLNEQSWIGRAMSRRKPVQVEKVDSLGVPAWSVDGTPTDCVNIALDHLLERKPDIVISGMNIGYNAGVPFILCSGTLGAAIEGAMWGYRALAVSAMVPPVYFQRLHEDNESVPAELEPQVRDIARHAAAFALNVVKEPVERYLVHNLNYPSTIDANTPVVETLPASVEPFGLYVKGETDGEFRFRFATGATIASDETNDRDCVASGRISHGLLDFSRIGRKG
ncbi:MAG: 5'/3'-nucleotidase SurE [Opitutales bacterium]|nr:5'/3'-nucleotidase SurE [Opitutales bacterium]